MPLTKARFRENCLKKIKKLHKHNEIYRNSLINKRLLEELNKRKKSSILFYMPLEFEADIRKTLTKIRRKDSVYIPFMVGESFKMVPFRLPLKEKRFGILEAGNTLRNIKKVDIVIVPTVGVDVNLQRVGFGKGMYDRFFAKLKKRPYTIFIQPEICYTKNKVCDSYDIKCDILLTPREKLVNKGNPLKEA